MEVDPTKAERPVKQTAQRGIIAWLAVPSAVLGLSLLVFQNLSAVCASTGVICPNPNPEAKAVQVSTSRTSPPTGFKAMKNDAPYATNWERVDKRPDEEFPQVITVFALPMTDDRKSGIEIANGEYVEIFKVHGSQAVTIQIRIAKSDSWVLSRQTFSLGSRPHLVSLDPEANIDAFKTYQFSFQDEIDTTRLLLRSGF